jgi:hypothetical protein
VAVKTVMKRIVYSASQDSFFPFDNMKVKQSHSGFGGLEDACWPLVPKFAGSNPAEAVGFFRAKKFPAHLPSEGK